MKYFLIAVNTENRIPYGLNANRAVDVRYANRKMAYKIPNCCVMDMKIPMEVFFPDILTSPVLLVSETFARVIEIYRRATFFKTVYVIDFEQEMSVTYFMPFLEELDCLADATVWKPGGVELKEIVLRKEAVEKKPVFRIAGFVHPYVVVRMDFLESLIRRGVKGYTLTELEVL